LTALAIGLSACSGAGDSEPGQAQKALTGFNVLTRAYDNQRTGVNASETILNSSNVNSAQFGKIFQVPVDDQVYASILYASNVQIAGGTHNVFYVATLNNSVFAFDADASGAPLWMRNFNGTGRPTLNSEVGQACGGYHDFDGHIGIVGSPVIDGASQTLYFVTRTVENNATVQRLHALDITSGAERSQSPKVIAGSVPGTGLGSSGGVLPFSPDLENQRAGLGFSNGVVYIAWSSFCDTGNFHGWVMGYDATTLAQVGIFNDSPGGGLAGIWMAGAAPAFDSAGNVYLSTGNGTFDGTANFGESLLKLAPRTLSLLDYFTPTNFDALNNADADFGSAGPIILPGTSNVLTGGKEGKAYLFPTSRLGHLGDANAAQIFQAVTPTARPSETHHIHNAMVGWNGPAGLTAFVWGENDFLHAYRFNGTQFTTPAAFTGSVLPPVGMPGGMISVSSNGVQPGTGVLWATTPRAGDANHGTVPGIMYAFNAENLSLLWQSSSPADDTLNFAKFNPPVVANGKVYLPSFSGAVSVYGLGGAQPSSNLALHKPATGSASCAADEGPNNAFNGSVSGGATDKFCSPNVPSWLQVDLGASYPVSQVIVKHAGAGGEDSTWDTRDFNLQVSVDGVTYTTVATVTGNTSDVSMHSFAPANARYVRLNIVTPTSSGNTATRIYEMEVYAVPGSVGTTTGGTGGSGGMSGSGGNGGNAGSAGNPNGGVGGTAGSAGGTAVGTTDIALNMPATGSTSCSVNELPAKAVDGHYSGDSSYKWCSLVAAPSLVVDLGAVQSIGQFVLRHSGAGGENSNWNTRDFNIQLSTDGVNYTTVVSVTGNTADVTVHNIPATNGRYVRLNVITPTSSSDSTAARIYELEVYAALGSTGSGGTGGVSGSGGASGTAGVSGTGGTGGVSGTGGTAGVSGTGGTGGVSGTGGTGGVSGSGGSGGSGGSANVGTVDLALNTTATGSASCSENEAWPKAVNGSYTGGSSDKWCSLAATPSLLIDLGSVQPVTQIVIRHSGAGGENSAWNTRDFNLQLSTDSTNFTTVATVTGNTADVTTHTFAVTNARYVRLNVITPTSSPDTTATRIYELEVYGPAGSIGVGGAGGTAGSGGSAGVSGTGGNAGTAGVSGSGGSGGNAGVSGSGGSGGSAGTGGTGSAGTGGTAGSGGTGGTGGTVNPTNLALNKTATGSTACNSNETPPKAVNGLYATGDASDKYCSTVAGASLKVDLGSSLPVSQIIVRHAGAGGEDPSMNTKAFNLQISTNGTTFTTVATVTGNTASTTTHNFTTASARYVRLNIVTPTQTTDKATRIYELEVRGP